jgi:hypothetical protein
MISEALVQFKRAGLLLGAVGPGSVLGTDMEWSDSQFIVV